MATSKVAQLRAQIALEYQASKRIFTDFTPTARHEYLIKRQENIAGYFEELKKHMSPEDAMLTMIQVDTEVNGLSTSPRAMP